MDLEGIPLFTMLRSRLGYLSAREALIAQNVANASTPGYAPKDLKPFSLPPSLGGEGKGVASITPATTSPLDLAAPSSSSSTGGWKAIASPDSDTTLDGNQVVLEDEMAKMTSSRLDYQAAIGFYQKALSMITLASKAPGK
jgi:flagellar basal-body rod protein FlgB